MVPEGRHGAGAAQEGGYEAMLARMRELLEQRGERYAAADLHVSLAADAGGAPDAGAPAAVVAWRRAAPRAPTCPPCVAPPSRAVVAASTAARGQSHASCVMPQRAWGGPQLPDATACLGRL